LLWKVKRERSHLPVEDLCQENPKKKAFCFSFRE
jgi:hypothetical protein